MADLDLSRYARDVVGDVLATAEAEDGSAPEVFTRRVLDDLEQAGEVENTFTAYHRSHGVEVHGYGENQSHGSLDLFVTHFRQSPLEDKLNRNQVEVLFRRLAGFLDRCRRGLRKDVEESSDVHDMCLAVEKMLAETVKLRFFLLTNSITTVASFPDDQIDNIPVSYEIWDLARLHRMATSGSLSEPIVVDFDPPLPCLATPTTDDNYSVFLAIMPGAVLSNLYGRYGTRLLELNVRSFLQTRGAVNKGIRETLIHNPERFLAYNNGITATASEVEFTELAHGAKAIRRIHDLQIVNGGQTTASIHYAHANGNADVTPVHVQMKLTRVAPEHLDEIVPAISKYSNTQNKVTIVDFSANHPLHVGIEKITRSLWAPAGEGRGVETKWFYERARGQYADELAREKTAASQRRFKIIHPTAQKFSKSDAAKYLNSWNGQPHLVSRGAEKNFREFMIQLGDTVPTVDVSYCQRLLAQAILFKATDKIVASHNFGGYKINITAYTVAKIADATDHRIDLETIWRRQKISEALTSALHDLCQPVQDAIVHPVIGNHIGEWAKRLACWTQVKEIDWDVPDDLARELMDAPDPAGFPTAGGDTAPADVAKVMGTPATDWFAVARWAKESHHLQPWQRQIAHTIGRYISNGVTVSERQAAQGIRLMTHAQELGFRPFTDTADGLSGVASDTFDADVDVSAD